MLIGGTCGSNEVLTRARFTPPCRVDIIRRFLESGRRRGDAQR